MNTKAFLFVLFLLPFLTDASTLDIYGTLTQKTLLIAPGLPAISDSVIANLPKEPTSAIAKMEEEFARNGITVVQDGPRFIRLLPAQQHERLLADVPIQTNAVRSSSETIPTGFVNFRNADPTQVLSLYAELSSRSVLRPVALPHSTVYLNTTCPVNRDELVYGLNTLLAMHGIAMVNDGDRFVQAVPMAQRTQVKAQAPRREASARLLQPNEIPAPGVAIVPAPASEIEREFQRCQDAFYKYINYKGPPTRPAFRLLELYAELSATVPIASKESDTEHIWFRVQTPVSKGELLYAIETTFRLNYLEIVSTSDGQLLLSRPGGHGAKAAKKSL